MHQESGWTTLSSTVAFPGRWLTIRVDEVERPDGSRGVHEFVDKPDFAVIIPVTEAGDCYLVEQYRYPVASRSWEFPQGGCESADNLLQCAERELREELGITAGNWRRLGNLWLAVGNSNQGFEVFAAEDLQFGSQSLDESEADLVGRTFSPAEIAAMIKSGEIRSSTTIASFHLLLHG